MLKFILKRIFYGFLVFLGVITVVFLLFNVLPGDPARMMLGQRADSASVAAINRDLGRDKPLTEQYFGYLNDLSPISIHHLINDDSFWFLDKEKYSKTIKLFSIGERVVVLKSPYFRRSYQTKQRVTDILFEAFPKTALLATVSITIALVFGLVIGIFAALYRDSIFDRVSLVFSVSGMAVPSFFAAILFAWIFAYLLADYTHLSMFGSLYSVDNFGRGEYLDLKNLILPAVVLGIRPLAIVVELTRSSLLDVLSADYIRTAKAKGLSKTKVILKHALKNSLNPVITAISGWFASLMAGAVFVEFVFDWKGVGVAIVNALTKYDFPVVMGAVLFISIILVFINIIVDIIYALLDPRIRLS
ncbi:MAG: ABC transporter permease [Bacteroidetes bacterium CG2_30_33_31]|nr:MAG: ABC transporter permease [Bacteroidetes bacterium CG2_30_33_31]